MTGTGTITSTYTAADIVNVFRDIGADLNMIAESTGAISVSTARTYQQDFELLAKKGYLKAVDITLFDGNDEVQAVKYTLETEASGWTANRPGGVLWPRVSSPYLRVVWTQTSSAWEQEVSTGRLKLNHSWTDSTDDISHASLAAKAGRTFVSNSFGAKRQDFS